MNQAAKNLVNTLAVVNLGGALLFAIVTQHLAIMFFGLVGFLGGWLYLLPSYIAFNRSHPNGWPIFALNFLLGWALLPWIGALVWALSRNVAAELLEQQRYEAQRVADKEREKQPETPVYGQPWAYREPAADAPKPGMRVCPHCAEHIKAAAIKCRYCGSAVEATGT